MHSRIKNQRDLVTRRSPVLTSAGKDIVVSEVLLVVYKKSMKREVVFLLTNNINIYVWCARRFMTWINVRNFLRKKKFCESNGTLLGVYTRKDSRKKSICKVCNEFYPQLCKTAHVSQRIKGPHRLV